MLLTDTHTHIYYTADTEEQQRQVERCLQNGIGRLFLPNVDLASMGMINSFVQKYNDIAYPMLGLHPCSVGQDYEQVLQEMYAGVNLNDYYAIGEIGIDLYWDKSTLAMQQKAFRLQADIALQAGLPIVIHCREAFNEVFALLEEYEGRGLRGILHCFTGDAEQAAKCISMGMLLGIGGVVTYKKSGLDAVLKTVPLTKVVLETDAPYLAPVPYRGKPNESSYLKYVAQKVADIYGMGVNEVAEQTTRNSKDVFGI